MLPIMQRAKIPQGYFTAEWLGIGAVAVLDIACVHAAGIRLILAWHDGLQIALGLGVMLSLKIFADRRGSMMAEYFALTAASTSVILVLSYACLALSGPLIDDRLLAADRALRFDWMAGYHFLLAHPAPQAVLKFAYNSMVYEDLFFCILLSLMDQKQRLRQVFWVAFISALLTCLGAALFPALGPYKSLGVAPPHSFLPEMEHLKSGHNLAFALKNMTGVVSFPSFHTVMALIYIWGFRRTQIIGWGATILNILMLLSIPWFGGHYLVDMIAGACVMLLSLSIVTLFENFSKSAPWSLSQPDVALPSV